jgi:hypothetical protein
VKVEFIPLAAVHDVWPHAEEFIKSGLEWGGDDYTIDQAKAFISRGEWMLLVAIEEGAVRGAAAVHIYNMPNYRTAFIISIGGKLVSSQDTFAQMCAIFRQFGANRIQGVARESIARLWSRYGFHEKYSLVEAKI